MGLNDRNYMRGGASGARNSGLSGHSAVWLLIAVNVAVFLIAPMGSQLHAQLVLTSSGFHVYEIVTSMFTHFGFDHLLLNMFGLYIFGSLIADRLGALRFVLLYLIGGAVGNLIFMMFFPGPNYALAGASGSCYAIMMATAMMEPNRQFVLLFLPFWPLKTRTLVIAFTVIELLSQSFGVSNVAHLAHLGGFLGGYLYMLFAARSLIVWMPFQPRRSASGGAWSAPRPVSPPPGPGFRASGPVSQRELDYLLDKISRSGINSLSEEEMARLRQAREDMQRR